MDIKHMNKQEFLDTYIMKEELQQFCKAEGLQSNGSKLELKEIIAHYLETGERKTIRKQKKRDDDADITLESVITLPITFSEKKRAFFMQYLGDSFRFYVPFQRWMKANEGKTYQDAIDAYPKIMEEKKKKKGSIDSQFEYNTYIRDFFVDNKGKSLKEAITCWNYKKAQKGSHAYEPSDLIALQSE